MLKFVASHTVGAARLALLGSTLAILAGCSMGNLMGTGVPAPSPAAQQFATATPTQAEMAQSASTALPAIATECPPIKVRPGSEAMFSYAGQTGDARTLKYQGIIDEVTRNCVVSNGLITVRMGVAGRLLLGPQSTSNNTDVAVRFAVERDGVPVFTERYVLPVAITPPNQQAEFLKVVENVGIPYVGGETIIIWVGFDPRG